MEKNINVQDLQHQERQLASRDVSELEAHLGSSSGVPSFQGGIRDFLSDIDSDTVCVDHKDYYLSVSVDETRLYQSPENTVIWLLDGSSATLTRNKQSVLSEKRFAEFDSLVKNALKAGVSGSASMTFWKKK